MACGTHNGRALIGLLRHQACLPEAHHLHLPLGPRHLEGHKQLRSSGTRWMDGWRGNALTLKKLDDEERCRASSHKLPPLNGCLSEATGLHSTQYNTPTLWEAGLLNPLKVERCDTLRVPRQRGNPGVPGQSGACRRYPAST